MDIYDEILCEDTSYNVSTHIILFNKIRNDLMLFELYLRTRRYHMQIYDAGLYGLKFNEINALTARLFFKLLSFLHDLISLVLCCKYMLFTWLKFFESTFSDIHIRVTTLPYHLDNKIIVSLNLVYFLWVLAQGYLFEAINIELFDRVCACDILYG